METVGSLFQERAELGRSFDEPVQFERWPDVPIDVVVGRDDRLFPREFQARGAAALPSSLSTGMRKR